MVNSATFRLLLALVASLALVAAIACGGAEEESTDAAPAAKSSDTTSSSDTASKAAPTQVPLQKAAELKSDQKDANKPVLAKADTKMTAAQDDFQYVPAYIGTINTLDPLHLSSAKIQNSPSQLSKVSSLQQKTDYLKNLRLSHHQMVLVTMEEPEELHGLADQALGRLGTTGTRKTLTRSSIYLTWDSLKLVKTVGLTLSEIVKV